jgi:DNA polymerase III delta prime subunit
MGKINSLWVEKYRPIDLENYICSDSTRNTIETYIKNQDIPHLMLVSKKPGTGKTTLGKLLVKNIDCDCLYINAADERSIDVMRDKVGAFASSNTFKSLKIVILDEASNLLQASQVLLLNMIETYSLKTRFILTGNYIERFIDPLRSRCTELDLSPPPKKIIAKHLANILDKESIKYELEDIVKVINKFYPDFRKIINYSQKFSLNGTLELDNKAELSEDYNKDILKELSKPKPNFTTIRQIISDSGYSEFDDLYRFLYDNSSTFIPGKEGQLSYIINEHIYQSNFRLDKEINIASCIAKIIELKLN